MAEFTPTDEQIRESVTTWRHMTWTEREYDRWLASHDGEVRSAALKEAVQAILTAKRSGHVGWLDAVRAIEAVDSSSSEEANTDRTTSDEAGERR